MPVWTDLLKLWTYASEMPDPLKRRDLGRNIDGAGVTQPDVIPDIRQDGSFWGGGSGQVVRLRDSNDFIDLSSVTNRQSRYKEYERLRSTAEIETAMTVYADESCVAGNTLVQTPLGPISIETLAKTRKPEELFLVYCYNFEKEDFDLGWAFHPRKTGTKETLRLTFNDGSTLLCTPDHKILKRNGEWVEAQHLKEKDEMMAFWRVRPTVTTTNKGVRFAKIFTHHSSFKSERRFIDEFRTELQSEKGQFIDKALHCLQKGLMLKDTAKFLDISEYRLRKILKSEFSNANQITKMHNRFPDIKRIVDIRSGPTTDVYDLSVKTHRNFCTDSAVVHNCQIGDNGRTFEIKTNSKAIKEELEFLFFNPKMLNVDRKIFSWAKNLYVFGDFFLELIIDPDAPGDGVVKVQELPPDSIYRIETIKGKLLEFQQSKEGPDYEALSKVEITQATDQDLMQSTAIRFTPNQIVHFRIGDSRKTFYPYGVSLIEPARGPAHLLRLLEDSMVVYRLCLNPKAKLLTNFGPKKISEVTLGDTVYSYENGVLVPSQITNIDIHKKKPVFKIRTKRRTITATGNHPFLTIDEKGNEQYVPAANLKKQNCHIAISPPSPENTPKKIERQLVGFYGKLPEDQKAIFRKAKYDNKSQMIREHLQSVGIKPIKSRVLRRWNWLACHGECRLPLAEAKVLAKRFNLGDPDVCGYSDRKNSPKFNVPEFVNEDIARLLGFIIAAGKINYHNKNKTSGHVRIKDAKNRMQEYCDIAVRSFGRKPDAKSPLKITAIDSIIILESLGLTNTHEHSEKRRYQFPDWIWKERIEIRKAFALGFIEGFGQVRQFKGNWYAYLKTTEATILHNIKALWESCGLSCGRLHRRRSIKKIRITKFFYRRRKVNDGFCLIFSQAQMPKTEKVLKVEYKNIQDVFDITVNHRAENFVAEGIVVHNSRAPERRAFFIDIGNMPPFRGMQLMQSIQDSLRKKKTYNSQAASGAGASPVEERFQPIGQDEDIFVPIKANSMTRIETLPGAQNLGEIDDAVYFRRKVFIALNFPANYMAQEQDASISRLNLSSVDAKVAKHIERLQGHITDGLMEIAIRHLALRGYPNDLYDDLEIKMTCPYPVREFSLNEIKDATFNRAMAVFGAKIYSHYDVLTRILKHNETEAKDIVARVNAQNLMDLKLQMMAQDPGMMGLTNPQAANNEMGTDANGPNPQLGPASEETPEQNTEQPTDNSEEQSAEDTYGKPEPAEKESIPEPSEEDIERFDMGMTNYAQGLDNEDIDVGELGDE